MKTVVTLYDQRGSLFLMLDAKIIFILHFSSGIVNIFFSADVGLLFVGFHKFSNTHNKSNMLLLSSL